MKKSRVEGKLIAHLHQAIRGPKIPIMRFPVLALELIKGSTRKLKFSNIPLKVHTGTILWCRKLKFYGMK